MAGYRFDFCGNAWAILRGRILAVALFLAYGVGGDFYSAIPLATLYLLVILFPWLLTTAKRFRLSNTAWRNLRFDFPGSIRNSYSQLALPLVLILLCLTVFLVARMQAAESLTLMESLRWHGYAAVLLFLASFLVVPLTVYRIKKLTFKTTCYGRHIFSANISLGRFMAIYAVTVLVLIGCLVMTWVIFTLVVMLSGESATSVIQMMQGKNPVAIAAFYFLLTLCYLLPVAFWNVSISNYVISAARLENLTMEMKMSVWLYWWYLWSNALLAILTLGMAIPLGKIRILKYKLSCLSIQGEIPAFHGDNTGRKTATGDEIGDAFNIEFGF